MAERDRDLLIYIDGQGQVQDLNSLSVDTQYQCSTPICTLLILANNQIEFNMKGLLPGIYNLHSSW